jgi:hypothetical protein
MGLPCRFISAGAGIVTFVMGEPEEDAPPAGKLVRLMIVSSAAPLNHPDDEDLSPGTPVNPGCDPNKSEYTPSGCRDPNRGLRIANRASVPLKLDAGFTAALANPTCRAAHWY